MSAAPLISGTDRGSPRLEEAALEAYRLRNESLSQCMLWQLRHRGFFAEFYDLAKAMIYAWQHDLQFVLDSTTFLYRLETGWCDYFEPFCRAADQVDPAAVRERFDFDPGDHRPLRRVQRFRVEELRIGDVHLRGFEQVLDFFQRMIFRPNAERAGRIREHIAALSLPERYLAVHIRRGNKIGDEDIYYPAHLYLRKLGDVPPGSCVFVMTDDYAAVEEVRHSLADTDCRVATLGTPADRGWEVNKLRRGKAFMSGVGSGRDGDPVPPSYLEQATTRFLAEVVVAANATRLVSTQRSFVGKTLRALCHPRPIALLIPKDNLAEWVEPVVHRTPI